MNCNATRGVFLAFAVLLACLSLAILTSKDLLLTSSFLKPLLPNNHTKSTGFADTNQNNNNKSATDDWLTNFIIKYGSGVDVFRSDYVANDKACRLVRGRRVVVTYGSHEQYLEQAKQGCRTAITFPHIDVCLVVTPNFLDDTFKQQNAKMFNQSRGAGYWLWKPYILLKLLLTIDAEDVLLYMDADKRLVNGIEEFICTQAELKQDVVVFYQEFVEYMWTKADAYLFMNVEHLPHVNDTMQIYASYLLLRKSINSVRFISEWLTYSQDERINSDEPSRFRKEHKSFKQNRYDQSVLSLLVKKWNIPNWPNPEREWRHPQINADDYGVVFKPFNSLSLSYGNYTTPTKPIIVRLY